MLYIPLYVGMLMSTRFISFEFEFVLREASATVTNNYFSLTMINCKVG